MIFLKALSGLSPKIFTQKIREAQIFAFSTASSNATIPLTLRVLTQKMGINNSVASFTVPFGTTINMDGTAIMQGVATVFIANIYGVDLGLTQYLIVILMSVLASIGTAGVPGVGLIMLSMGWLAHRRYRLDSRRGSADGYAAHHGQCIRRCGSRCNRREKRKANGFDGVQ